MCPRSLAQFYNGSIKTIKIDRIFLDIQYICSVDIERGVKGILITFPRQRDKETKRRHEFDMGRYERGSEIENRVSKRDIARKRRRDRV